MPDNKTISYYVVIIKKNVIVIFLNLNALKIVQLYQFLLITESLCSRVALLFLPFLASLICF